MRPTLEVPPVRIAVLALCAVVTTLALLVGDGLAASPSVCPSTKYKAAARKVYGKAKCHQKALLKASFPTDDCLARVEQKFIAAFAKADANGGCVAQDNASDVEAVVDDCLASFTTAITGDAKCSAAKTKALGRRAYDEMRCRLRALLRGGSVDAQCLGKAELRFTTAITKADGLGTCSDTAMALETLVDACMTTLHRGCGEDAGSFTCGAPCGPGLVCTAVSTFPWECSCVQSCATTYDWPTCGGACDPGWACAPLGPLPYCGCVPSCLTSEAPTCGGTCPDGGLCVQPFGSNSCECVSPDNTCTISEAPVCGGTCPTLACCPAGQSCGESSLGDGCNCMCPPSSLACPFSAKWGTYGSGDGQFISPWSIAVDPSGNVFVTDIGTGRIQKFTSTGTFLTSWGGSGTGDGQFAGPEGIAVDASGNVFIVDLFNNRIQEFDNAGTFLTKWGSFGNGDGQFNEPNGIAVDAAGDVFVIEAGNSRIQKFTGAGTFITKWGSAGSGDGEFEYPTDVAVDGSDNVFVLDVVSNRIQKFTGSGTFLSKWGAAGSGEGQFNHPSGVDVDESGNVLVADHANSRIQKFDNNGTFLATWGCPGIGDGHFIHAADVAADGSGNVFVADNPIQKFSCP